MTRKKHNVHSSLHSFSIFQNSGTSNIKHILMGMYFLWNEKKKAKTYMDSLNANSYVLVMSHMTIKLHINWDILTDIALGYNNPQKTAKNSYFVMIKVSKHI